MRIFDRRFLWIWAAMLPAACRDAGESPQHVMKQAQNENRSVVCMTGGRTAFVEDCTLEWRATDGSGRRILVLRQSRGGFRRLLVRDDGTMGQADGANPLRLVRQDSQRVEIAIDGDHYVMAPAQLRAPRP